MAEKKPKVEKKAVVKTPETQAVVKKEKKPKFKLLTYTIKAVIPTGMYANIQPEITVQADTIEHAERAVMPHIEALFAKYREGGPAPVRPVVVTPAVPVVPSPSTGTPVVPTNTAPVVISQAPAPTTTAPVAPVAPAIVMNAPFNKAKAAIESCMSHDALKLVSEQIEKSTKLIDTEKVELKGLVTIKYNDITIAKSA